MLNATPHTPVQRPPSEMRPDADIEKKKILIVEDEALLALHAEQVLSDAGFLVVGAAANARSAIRLAEVARPDLVLMDVRLRTHTPDGVDTAVEIQQRFGIATIFVSANAETARSPRAAAAKAVGVIAKPYSDAELVRAVRAAFYPSA